MINIELEIDNLKEMSYTRNRAFRTMFEIETEIHKKEFLLLKEINRILKEKKYFENLEKSLVKYFSEKDLEEIELSKIKVFAPREIRISLEDDVISFLIHIVFLLPYKSFSSKNDFIYFKLKIPFYLKNSSTMFVDFHKINKIKERITKSLNKKDDKRTILEAISDSYDNLLSVESKQHEEISVTEIFKKELNYYRLDNLKEFVERYLVNNYTWFERIFKRTSLKREAFRNFNEEKEKLEDDIEGSERACSKYSALQINIKNKLSKLEEEHKYIERCEVSIELYEFFKNLLKIEELSNV